MTGSTKVRQKPNMRHIETALGTSLDADPVRERIDFREILPHCQQIQKLQRGSLVERVVCNTKGKPKRERANHTVYCRESSNENVSSDEQNQDCPEIRLTFFLAASSSSAFLFLSARTPTRRALERATRRARKAEKSFSSEVISRGSSLTIPAGMGKAAETLETRSVDLSAP